jgi:endonuclease/exonuclease/phosphatase family metal-dependent hydrolase
MIADEHVYIGDSKLTIRDKHVVDLILQTISHPTRPQSIVSLQECGNPFLNELKSRLPAHFTLISNHGEALLLDKRRFQIVEAKNVSGIFAEAPYRTIQDNTLRRLDNGQNLRLVNVHLPGDPTKPGRFEFGQYLAKTFDPDLTTIAMGDMNFDELEMSDAMSQAFQNNSPFDLYSPYCTNISPSTFKSKAIDHFLVYSPHQSRATLSSPDQIMPGLAPIVDLLQGKSRKLCVFE